MDNLGRGRIFLLNPADQHGLELLGIDFLEQSAQGALARHVILSGSTQPRPTVQAATLRVIKAGCKLGYGVRPFATGDSRQAKEGQAAGQFMA
jgi:hypothetical protein